MISALRSSALAAALAIAFAAAPLALPVATAQQAPDDDAVYDVYARYRDDPKMTTEALENGLWRARLPLAALRPESGAIRLDGAKDTEQVSFAIAPQADIQSARLILRHVSGRAQEGSKPQLRLGLNGRFIAQVDGVTEHAAAVNEIVLDPSILVSGFNTLQIDAVQRYTYGCQDPSAAELWTDIDTSRSYVEVIYAREPFTASLADLSAVLTAGVGGVDDLALVTGRGEMTADTLRWGALASQAVANRLGYTVPRISRMDAATFAATSGKSDLIAIGTPEDLAGLAPAALSNLKGDESWLSIGPSPVDRSRFLIVLSGRTPAAIEGAVRAFAAVNFPLSDTPSLVLAPDEVPAGHLMARKQVLRTEAKYTLKDLGLTHASLLGEEHGTAGFTLDLPADVRFRTDAEVLLSLDFAYGAGLDDKSVVNILVNDQFQRAIRLTNPDGEVTPGYEIALPAAAFRPGHNSVRFEVELSTGAAGECAARDTRHLAFVLKDTSTLALPPAGQYAELPNLALLSEAGFPYAGAGIQPVAIRATDTGNDTAAAVWTLAARLGQIYGTIFTDATFGFGLELPEAHTLIVGTRPDLKGFLPAELSMSNLLSGAAPDGFTRNVSTVDLGDNGLLIEGESPEHAGYLVTVLTAETGTQLLASTRALVQPSHWSQLQGGTAVWREHAATMVTQAARNGFEIGSMPVGEKARLAAGRTPWGWILSIAAVLFALAAVLALIARYMRKRMNEK